MLQYLPPYRLDVKLYCCIGFLLWSVSFGIIYCFEFDRYQVLKIKIKAESFVHMILPYALAND